MLLPRWFVLLGLLLAVLLAGSEAKKKRVNGGKRPGNSAVEGSARLCPVSEGSVELLLKAGENLFTQNLAAAEDCYKRALVSDHNSVLARYNLGLSQMNQGKHNDAIANFEEVIAAHRT